ncbi:MAG: SDR family NAD(P)-dependent oxidoreductase [Ruminococcaceae bacterium]|nr:SDR family NAD(P)-dependent oxidoreductase [Oscillospiraceae bacterium]
MKEFKGKTAVITGAAHGFGAVLALEAARRGMKLLLADIDAPALDAVAAEARALGAEATAFAADLSLYENVHEMIARAVATYGTVDLLINNAGIAFRGKVWAVPPTDVDWMIDINLKAMLWGMHEAMPIMMAQGTPCHIVNVSSGAGITTARGMAAYHATKHAVVAATESTAYDLEEQGITNIGLTLFLPGYIQTDLHHCEQRRPARYRQDMPYHRTGTWRADQAQLEADITGGLPIDVVVPAVFGAIENDQFYVVTHPETLKIVAVRAEDMIEGRTPSIARLRSALT